MVQKKHIFYWFHGIIFIIGLFICSYLIYGTVSGTDRGHPPAIIFLPFIVIAWLFLHAFLFLTQWLVSRGNKNALKRGNANNSWPITLIVFMILCGISSLVGFAGLASMLFSGRLPTHTSQWLNLLFFGISFVSLCGILLRKNWGRLVAGLSCLLVSGFMTYIIIRTVIIRPNYDIGAGIYVILIVIGFGFFGFHLLTSERIKTFIKNN